MINIVTGHIKELFGMNKELFETRMKICSECPIYFQAPLIGAMCNTKLYINPETNDISRKEKDGYFKGCGCRLDAKTREYNESCPAGKW